MATIRDDDPLRLVPDYEHSRLHYERDDNPLLRDLAFSRHSINDGHHISPYAQGHLDVGLDNLQVRLVQGIDEASFRKTLSRAQQATIGLPAEGEPDTSDWEEMMKGGLQTALESQTVIFEVIGVARAATHQIVRSRRAAFHQQSMRASFFGNRPNTRIPESIHRSSRTYEAAVKAIEAAHEAYRIACEEDVSYQDARYLLPIGTETYIMCEYTVREFLAVYAYRACSMFQWEICHIVREMGRLLSEAHPWLEPYIKISCQSGPCQECGGIGYVQTEWADTDDPTVLARLIPDTVAGGTALLICDRCLGTKKEGSKCTFQGWEQVEDQCGFPWAKEDLRTFKPKAHLIESIKRKPCDHDEGIGKPRRCTKCGEDIEEYVNRDRAEKHRLHLAALGELAHAEMEQRRMRHCPSCGGRDMHKHPATGAGGEVELCGDPWHLPAVQPEVERMRQEKVQAWWLRAGEYRDELLASIEDITPVRFDSKGIEEAAQRHPSRWPLDPQLPVVRVDAELEED